MALLGLITMVRNEERLIGEFLAHHLALGVQRVLVFDNGSTDGTRLILRQAATACPAISVEPWRGTHKAAFQRGIEAMRAEVDWVLALDCDEFVVAPEGETMADFLAARAGHAAIGLHWAIFGSAGHLTPPDDLMTASFLRRGPDEIGPNRHIKSLVRPRFVQGVWNSHAFSLDEAEFPYVNARGERLCWIGPQGLAHNAPVLSPVRVHHYFCRDRSFWEQKMQRAREASRRIRNSARTEADWDAHDRNEIVDESALLHVPRTRAMLERLGLDRLGRFPGPPGRESDAAPAEPAGRSAWIAAKAAALRQQAAGATADEAALLRREADRHDIWARERG